MYVFELCKLSCQTGLDYVIKFNRMLTLRLSHEYSMCNYLIAEPEGSIPQPAIGHDSDPVTPTSIKFLSALSSHLLLRHLSGRFQNSYVTIIITIIYT
jgi:hypothetical protein